MVSIDQLDGRGVIMRNPLHGLAWWVITPACKERGVQRA